MTKKGNTLLLEIAAQRVREAVQKNSHEFHNAENALYQKIEQQAREASQRIQKAVNADIAKLSSKLEKLVNGEVAKNSELFATNGGRVQVNFNVHMKSRGPTYPESLNKMSNDLWAKYRELELTVALADSNASMKELFEKFIESLS